jgi:hypothetical protein
MNAALRLAPALTLLFAAGALAQAPPVPGPEHEILKRDVGVWDVVVEMLFPGAPPMTMSGVETNTLVAGRWLVSEFRAEMMGQAFEGRGITGWDPGKKVYTGVWVDSMGTSLNLAEASHGAPRRRARAPSRGARRGRAGELALALVGELADRRGLAVARVEPPGLDPRTPDGLSILTVNGLPTGAYTMA